VLLRNVRPLHQLVDCLVISQLSSKPPWPTRPAVAELDIIGAHHSLLHPAIGRKCPVLETICAPPHFVAACRLGRIPVLVPELYRDAIVAESKKLFA
jgi:hypothetical protein